MFNIKEYRNVIERALSDYAYGQNPTELYAPIHYVIGLGGKRLRPLLVGLSYHLFADDWQKTTEGGIAVEIFHNFTLLHDDIMDKAPLRRGMPTVHQKWNDSIAILSGDVMLIIVYEILTKIESHRLKEILERFNLCAKEVCEGQQWDMNFESLESVPLETYISMIRQKTAVLLGFSLALGAILADAPITTVNQLYEIGVSMGISFQLKDDLLDVFGQSEKFGKQVGGDIIVNKKTFLLIKALELSKGELREELLHWLSLKEFDATEKVAKVSEIYKQLGIIEITYLEIEQYYEQGLRLINDLDVSEDRKSLLINFMKELMNREN
ncbi:MAG: polyprenyl synthetase family protein [Cytophagales bacterium]|nr:MAG: polyprenyl synthetase family protein [Cytophagales bacterium]